MSDIDRLTEIRGAVHENRLSSPLSVTRADYERFVGHGRVWVCEVENTIVGFAASDERNGTIWALFLDPIRQGMGYGQTLLGMACRDLKHDGYSQISLTTDAGTRAERFYRRSGWVETDWSEAGELRFILTL